MPFFLISSNVSGQATKTIKIRNTYVPLTLFIRRTGGLFVFSTLLIFMILFVIIWDVGEVDKEIAKISKLIITKDVKRSERTVATKSRQDRPSRRHVLVKGKWVPLSKNALTEVEVSTAIAQASCNHHREFLLKVSMCESSWIPTNSNGVDVGITAIYEKNVPKLGFSLPDRLDPVKNFIMACKLLDESPKGKKNWDSSKECYRDGPNMDSDHIRDGWTWLETV